MSCTTDAFGNEVPSWPCEEHDHPQRGRDYPYDLRKVRVPEKVNRTKVQEFDPGVIDRFIGTATPETPLQALVEAGFGDEPEESVLERELRLEPIRRAIEECLTPRERHVIEAKFWRGRGLDLTADELNLSKTHVARIRDMALRKLREYLEGDDEDCTSDG